MYSALLVGKTPAVRFRPSTRENSRRLDHTKTTSLLLILLSEGGQQIGHLENAEEPVQMDQRALPLLLLRQVSAPRLAFAAKSFKAFLMRPENLDRPVPCWSD